MATQSPSRQTEPIDRKPSAQEVAELAGVSLVTVSRALNDSPLVSEPTRRRVLEAAERLGYRPNLAGRMLRTGRTQMVGFLLGDYRSLQGVFHADALAGFESEMSRQGYSVILASSPNGRSMAALADEMQRDRCDGLLVHAEEVRPEEMEALRRLPVPLVLLNYNPDEPSERLELTSVGFDNRNAVIRVVRHLAALGHRRMAFIGGSPNNYDALRREEGFREGLRERGLPCEERWIRRGEFAEGARCGVREMDYLMGEGPKGPTAVVCATDEFALGARSCAFRCGYSIPADLSLVGFDNTLAAAHTSPPLTSVDHPGWGLGATAAELLFARIENPELAPERRVFEAELIIRESTAPPRDGGRG